MHHFFHADKLKLYLSICDALKHGGKYIGCGYMVLDQKEEDFYYSEERIRREQGVPNG